MDPDLHGSIRRYVARKFRGLELQIGQSVRNCSTNAVKRLVRNCILMPSKPASHLARQLEDSYKYEWRETFATGYGQSRRDCESFEGRNFCRR
jgi:hypothetical protein